MATTARNENLVSIIDRPQEVLSLVYVVTEADATKQ
jgi:hypothetical protein